MKNQVISFETAKKLKELGVEQGYFKDLNFHPSSLYYWSEPIMPGDLQTPKLNDHILPVDSWNNYSAFTALELLHLLRKKGGGDITIPLSENNILDFLSQKLL